MFSLRTVKSVMFNGPDWPKFCGLWLFYFLSRPWLENQRGVLLWSLCVKMSPASVSSSASQTLWTPYLKFHKTNDDGTWWVQACSPPEELDLINHEIKSCCHNCYERICQIYFFNICPAPGYLPKIHSKLTLLIILPSESGAPQWPVLLTMYNVNVLALF